MVNHTEEYEAPVGAEGQGAEEPEYANEECDETYWHIFHELEVLDDRYSGLEISER